MAPGGVRDSVTVLPAPSHDLLPHTCATPTLRPALSISAPVVRRRCGNPGRCAGAWREPSVDHPWRIQCSAPFCRLVSCSRPASPSPWAAPPPPRRSPPPSRWPTASKSTACRCTTRSPAQGDPLVVLHGAYMNIPTMGAIIPKLAETHKVYALEFQGHGRTTDIDRPITYPNLADDVAAFMDAVGLEKADVFGYSMGAAAGLQLAIRHPAKVNKLVVASARLRRRGLAAGVQGVHPADDGRDVRRDAVRRGVPQARAPTPTAFPRWSRS